MKTAHQALSPKRVSHLSHLAGEPKYAKIAAHLRRQMKSGALRPGDCLPSFPAMRSEGISQSTLERVHALLESEGLIVREKGRGVFVAPVQPRAAACIGLLSRSSEQRHPYLAHLLEGVEEEAHRQGAEIRLLNPAQIENWAKVDGVVLFQPDESAYRRVPEGLPGVLLLAHHAAMTSVQADDYQGARLAVEHLVGLGHRRIAFLTMGYDPFSQRRLQAYHDVLQESGIKANPAWVRPMQYDPATRFVSVGRFNMRRWLDEDWRELGCTALLAHNDETAIGALEVLADHGLRVPDNLSVVGFDGTELCDYTQPRLTSIEVPLNAIGAAGVQNLLRQIAGEKPPQATQLPTRLKSGGTTAKA